MGSTFFDFLSDDGDDFLAVFEDCQGGVQDKDDYVDDFVVSYAGTPPFCSCFVVEAGAFCWRWFLIRR